MKTSPGPLLAQRTTLGLGGRAIAEVIVESDGDLEDLPGLLGRLGGYPLVLGEGSNILAADHDLPVVLVRVAAAGRFRDFPRGEPLLREGQGRSVTVRVSAGMRLPRLLGWLQAHGVSGLEELTGIPGSVGGAVAMNAGSYGREIKQVLGRVWVWSAADGLVQSAPGRWRAGYRFFDAGLQGLPALVLGAELILQRFPGEGIRDRMRRCYSMKKKSQPLTMSSAGCVFKNPSPDRPAGRLLDEVGLRGRRLGEMAFSERHANFLVNLGGGRAEDALELLDLARARVRERFGVELETEVRIVS